MTGDPRGGTPGCHLQLTESPSGWLLTLTLGPDAAEYFARPLRTGLSALTPGQVSVSISPNLVPGEPFDLTAVQVVVATAREAETVEGLR